MGATASETGAFRKIRGNGAVALVPGWGHQRGAFDLVEPLLVREGPLKGHWGILSSSRAHCFSWLEKYGGSGDPLQLAGEMARAIAAFRKAECLAYQAADYPYPF